MSDTLTRQPFLDQRPLPSSLVPTKVQPAPDPGTAVISVQSVLTNQGRMGYGQPSPLPLAPTSTYHSPQNGGTQRAALAEMAGYRLP